MLNGAPTRLRKTQARRATVRRKRASDPALSFSRFLEDVRGRVRREDRGGITSLVSKVGRRVNPG